jgi:Cu-Zn family superoxide dismutase
MFKKAMYLSIILLTSSYAYSKSITVPVFNTNQVDIGQIEFEDSKYGLLIRPALQQLPPGLHGFHIHEHPNCEDHAMKAGSHFDPQHTNKHLGPYQDGHMGDLPVLFVDAKGEANTTMLAPRLSVDKIQNHAIMIHENGDNYDYVPSPLGGGGARIACGIIK